MNGADIVPPTPEQLHLQSRAALDEMVGAVKELIGATHPVIVSQEARIQCSITHAQFYALIKLLQEKGIVQPIELDQANLESFTRLESEFRQRTMAQGGSSRIALPRPKL